MSPAPHTPSHKLQMKSHKNGTTVTFLLARGIVDHDKKRTIDFLKTSILDMNDDIKSITDDIFSLHSELMERASDILNPLEFQGDTRYASFDIRLELTPLSKEEIEALQEHLTEVMAEDEPNEVCN